MLRLADQSGKTGPQAFAVSRTSLLISLLCAGCANPGPPKPPSLHLPSVVKDLQATRTGDEVILRWTTPSRTTDEIAIAESMTAQICRESGAAPLTPIARAAACAPVRRLAVVPGPSEVADILPPALQSDPVVLLTYRVQIFNSTGHSAGDSAEAYAASGAAPPPIASLRATANEQGAILEWQPDASRTAIPTHGPAPAFVDLTRTTLSEPSTREKGPKPAQTQTSKRSQPAAPATPGRDTPAPDQSAKKHLRTADTGTIASSNTIAGTVDLTATMGSTYTYVAERVRPLTIGTHTLEIRSGPSPPVTVAMRDTFPPHTPTGLATIAGGAASPYIDLSWEPNAEPDLAGYRVYRQLARPDGSPQGPLGRLTASLLAAPAYRDVAVRPGQGYIYTVTAVDAAGNESAPSAKALETIPPDTGESPH